MTIPVGEPGSKIGVGLRLVQLAASIAAVYCMTLASNYNKFQDFIILCFAALGSAAWSLVHVGVEIYAIAKSPQLSWWIYIFNFDLVIWAIMTFAAGTSTGIVAFLVIDIPRFCIPESDHQCNRYVESVIAAWIAWVIHTTLTGASGWIIVKDHSRVIVL